MGILTSAHIERALQDVATNGDNDLLPFDIDSRFIGERKTELTDALFDFGHNLEKKTVSDLKSTLDSIPMFSEKLLAPAGYSGFRVATKMDPYWCLYFNSISVAIAQRHETIRSQRAHSYRFSDNDGPLFDQSASWRKFLEDVLTELESDNYNGVVVQTDISSFYDHVYHHRLKNFLADLLGVDTNIPMQVEEILPKFSGGRSFGLPVGGQGARMVSEVFLSSIDRSLAAEGVRWHRYVDDFVLLTDDQHDAYRVLGILARALSDVGLSLNRTKTSFLSAANYRDYVRARLGASDEETKKLIEIDLHFDPYSDAALSDYKALRDTVEQLDIERLLARELEKSQADTLVVAQVGRSLRAMEPKRALALAKTLLEPKNLHSFRASWSTIMRAIARIRAEQSHAEIMGELDEVLDEIPKHSSHLVFIDTNCLHYLRTIRSATTAKRQEFVLTVFKSPRDTVRRACIDCWISWRDRERFLALRNNWQSLSEAEQRILWLGAAEFRDDGMHFRRQEKSTISKLWKVAAFTKAYTSWVEDVAPTR
jgi:hypothetical protein